MRVIDVEQVIATHRHEWRKWPDTEDRDYGPIFAERRTWYFRRGDVEIRVHNRYYPVYSAYVRSGDERLPIQFPVINNLCPPSDRVLEQQRYDLMRISRGETLTLGFDGPPKAVRALLWEHTHQCFPQVAPILPELFPLVRTIAFGDDCPGSSDVKTFPVAAYFSALFHQMFVWDADTGSLVSDEYKRRGLPYTRFCPSGMSAGLAEGLRDLNFSIDAKLDRISERTTDPDFTFIGFTGGGERAQTLRGLCLAHARQKQLGLTMRMHGIGMPDGVLEPRDPPHPKGLAYPMAPIYVGALSGVNMPVSSIWNCRTADLWASGVVQIVRDRWGELSRQGFVDGEHFLSFDGTVEHLLAQVDRVRTDRSLARDLARAGHDKATDFYRRNSWQEAHADIYFEHCAGEPSREEAHGSDAAVDTTLVAGFRR